MNILITAGGTSEYIDSVRKITNTSTGRLSSLIYTSLLESSIKSLEIDYIKTPEAITPKINNKNTLVHQITNTSDLEKCINGLATKKTYDVIIHCMAVSDFYVDKACEITSLVSQIDQLRQEVSAQSFKKALTDLLSDGATFQKPEKLSSKEDVYLSLKRTPKIISILRKQHPSASLIGFKLLNNVSQEVLLSVGSDLGRRYGCELVIANDKSQISGDNHEAILIKEGQIISHASTKQMIAKTLVKYIVEQAERGLK